MEASGNGLIGGDPEAGAAPLLQPHNLDAEQSVLGAMMVSLAALDPVLGEARLRGEDFYRGRHATIYAAIQELYERNEPVDALTVAEHLRALGKLEEVGGQDVINSLAATTPVPGNAGHYAQIVKQNSMLRRLLGAAQRIQQSVQSREGEPQDLVEQAEVLLFNVARAEQAGDFSSLEAILDVELSKLDKLASGDAQMTGTPSGFKKLDEITGGFQPGNLVVLAARPAMGKSSLVCNIAENVAWKAKRPVAFFSLEMSETELAHRFIASRARIPSDRLRKGNIQKDWNKVLKAANELADAPLFIDDSSDLSLLDLRAKCRRLHSQQGGLGLVIVDYIQLMRSEDPRAGRVEQVGQMSRGLKILARELEVPVIGISQLSRAPEQRPDKRPILSDLRESGCLAGETRVFLPDSGGWTTMRELAALADPAVVRVLALDEERMKLVPRRLTNAFSTGVKPLYKLRTKLGRTIRATGNHRFRTIDGWHRLDELEVGDSLALPRELPTAPGEATMRGDELAFLGQLLRQGINSTVRRAATHKKGQWHVDVSGAAETIRLLQFVGASGAAKRGPANAIIEHLRENAVANTNRDVIPRSAWTTVVKPAMAAAGVSAREMQARIGTAYCGSTLYRANLGRGRGRSRGRAAAVAEAVESPVLARLAESDLYWDPVVAIEPDGAEEVFDLTVEGLHNFVADDIVVHNSIEQDADIVSFIYRDEYYNEETERLGEADLIIAKHRNGPIGTVALAFQEQFPKFVNLASSQAYAGEPEAEPGEAA
ncbi:MAG: replicative DNA helicase [Acidobacteria bacterium]|nr:MAG: replicative DNA helicase [Acidobacteriota bacterium]